MLSAQSDTVLFMPLPKGKSLTVEQNARVREVTRRLLAEHDDNRTRLAKELGITQAGLSSFLLERTGAGFQLASAIAAKTGVSLSELINGVADADSDTTDEPRYSNLPGWKENEPEARRQTGYPEWVFVRARRMRGLVPPAGATVKFITDAADAVMKHMPMSEKVAEAEKQLENELKRIEGRAAKRGKKKPPEGK